MTSPPPYPGASESRSDSSGSPYAAYGQYPANAPYTGAPYGRVPTPASAIYGRAPRPAPAGYNSYVDASQFAIPTQSVPRAPGGPPSTGHPYSALETAYYSGATHIPGHPSQSAHSNVRSGTLPPASTSAPIAWRGEKLATLLLIATSCALQAAYFFFLWQDVLHGSGWLNFLLLALIHVSVSPPVWWLLASTHNLFMNRAGSSMIAMSTWFILNTITLPSGAQITPRNDILAVITILTLITTTVGAVLTTLLNRRLNPYRSAPVTLSLASCEFILAITVFQLISLTWHIHASKPSIADISHYTAGIWVAWSTSGRPGVPLVPGMIVTLTLMFLSLGSLLLGTRTPYRSAFRVLAITPSLLLTTYNLLVFAVYGISTQRTNTTEPLVPGVELLAIIITGTILIGSAAAAGHRSTVNWFNHNGADHSQDPRAQGTSAYGPHPGR